MDETASKFANISVIVAAYEAATTIGRTLQSIAAQTLKPREVIVVDDGSTDGTFEAAEAETPNMNGIALRVFKTEENHGAGAARNRAIAESREPILAFLDADDEWLSEKLERSLHFLEGGDYVLVAHDYWTGQDTVAQHHDCERRFREAVDPFVGLYRKGYIASCSVVAKRDAVIVAGGFDPGLRNAQDFDLWLAMLRNPECRLLVFGEPLLRYHPGPGGIMSHTQRRLKCGLEIAARYFPDLRFRPGSALASLWFRIAALHLEAARAYRTKGDIGQMLWIFGRLPFSLLLMTFQCHLPAPPRRGRFLDTKDLARNE